MIDRSAAKTLFCFGLGYSAERLARALRAENWRVRGTVRDAARAERLKALGFEMHSFDGTRALADRGALDAATHVLLSIPPDATGDPALKFHRDSFARGKALQWLGYFSTTGVYGDRGGAWVDENDDLRPSSARARQRVEAERAWLDLQRESGVAVHIFRLPGIYGPGRSAFDQLRAGTAKRIDKPGQFFSRIHVDDIAGALRASIARPNPGAVYNVCDDEPAPASDVVAFAAHLLGVEPPPLEPYEPDRLTPMAASFYQDNRRVRNARLKAELGYVLRYPTYREGLRAILASRHG
ncbi:MAG: SDR family oxidoreductase [Alphaproteobacteria bacterium]